MSFISATTNLEVKVCKDAADAVDQGFHYTHPEYTGLRIEKAVIVQEGTTEGHSTVDLILVDETGKKFVTMITGRLLAALPLT